MAHFAKLDANNVVVAVVVGRDEDNENELSARTGDTYKKTSYNTSDGIHYGADGKPDGQLGFRGNYAGIGMIYDPVKEIFTNPNN
jgi:hypothetical protein